MHLTSSRKTTRRNAHPVLAALILLLVNDVASPVAAQVRFQLVGANPVAANTSVCADEIVCTGLATPVIPLPCAANTLTPGLLGHEYGIRCYTLIRDPGPFPAPPPPPGCDTFMTGEAKARAFFDGDNTRAVTLAWQVLAYCQSYDESDNADAIASLALGLQLEIVDPAAPNGSPVIVYYSWDAFGGANTTHECNCPPPNNDGHCAPTNNEEDMVCVTNFLNINGPDVLAGRFDLGSGTVIDDCAGVLLPNGPVTCPSSLTGFNKKNNQSGVILSAVGQQININLISNLEAHLRNCWPEPLQNVTWSGANFIGTLRLTVGHPPPPPLPPPLPLQFATFSVDIGSDKELSDFLPPAGPVVFDPGDCYEWGKALTPCPPEDGVLDDLTLFNGMFDPAPAMFLHPPPNPNCNMGITSAPLCGGSLQPQAYFDLDDYDTLDVSLAGVLGADPGPVPFFPSNCIDSTDHLAISFDDDAPQHYGDPSCAVPARSYSPYLGTIFGTTSARDEVVGIETIPLVSPPRAIALLSYPIADETTVHPLLAPNPGNTNNQDDDVDGLDMVIDPTICTFWYVSADHEANGDPIAGIILDPGNIYLRLPGLPPTLIVDHALHLGLLDGVDIDAFEFAWLYNDAANAVHLALLFSVDVDDPAFGGDQSGGLDPRMVYASFMNGVSFPFFTTPLSENIDAITTWRNDLLPPITTGACCQANGACVITDQATCLLAAANVFRGVGTDCADVNQDGAADVCECVNCRGDMNGDGSINGRDITLFVKCYVGPPPANCGCADMNASAGALTPADVALFVAALLQWPAFPCL